MIKAAEIMTWYTILFYYFLVVMVVTLFIGVFKKHSSGGNGHPVMAMIVSFLEALVCLAFKFYGAAYDLLQIYVAFGFLVLAGVSTLLMVVRADGKWIYIGASIMCTVAAMMLWNISVQ